LGLKSCRLWAQPDRTIRYPVRATSGRDRHANAAEFRSGKNEAFHPQHVFFWISGGFKVLGGFAKVPKFLPCLPSFAKMEFGGTPALQPNDG